MIKLTYRTINDHVFIDGLRHIVNAEFPLKVSWHISRIQDKIFQESKVAQAEWQKILKTRVEWVEEEGKPKLPKDPVALKKLEDEFLAIEFDCGKWNKIHVQDLHTAKLTPLQLSALQPILTGLETLEDETPAEAGLKVVEGGKQDG